MADDTTQKGKKLKNPKDNGEAISHALQAKYDITRERASNRIALRDDSGKVMPKLSEDDWEQVLERIANGEIPAQVMRSYGCEPHALISKEKRDQDFCRALSEAYAAAFFNHMIDARSVARGLEGYTTGSIERDKLVIDTDYRMAKALVPRLIDKQQVEQRSVIINLNNQDTDW